MQYICENFLICDLMFDFRVSLGDRLKREELSGVVRSSGSSVGEKELTFSVKKVLVIWLLLSSLRPDE